MNEVRDIVGSLLVAIGFRIMTEAGVQELATTTMADTLADTQPPTG